MTNLGAHTRQFIRALWFYSEKLKTWTSELAFIPLYYHPKSENKAKQVTLNELCNPGESSRLSVKQNKQI